MRSAKMLVRPAAAVILCLGLTGTACWKVEPDLWLSDSEINFGPATSEADVTVTNDSKDKTLTSGVTDLNYEFKSDRAWITVSPVAGRLAGEESVTHVISIDRDALASGENLGTVTVTSNGGTGTIIVHAVRMSGNCSGTPTASTDPTPDHQASDVSPAPQLSWRGGGSQCDGLTATYDVYFGTGTPPPFHHNNGSSKSWDPDRLEAGTRYYWRVVAKDATGSTSSATWNFRTGEMVSCTKGPGDLTSLSPPNNEDDVSLNQDLSWSGGASQCDGLTATYDVYFGTNDPPPFHHNNGSDKSWDPGLLAQDRTYYWRIVAKDPNGSKSSATRQFRTLECETAFSAPCKPSPGDEKSKVNPKEDLAWGCGAEYDDDDECGDDDVSYVVYFGTSATLTDAHRKGTTTSRSYDLQTLAGRTTYYWKVVTTTSDGSKSSPVWSFKTR